MLSRIRARLRGFLSITLCIFIFLETAMSFYTYNNINNIKVVAMPSNKIELGINNDVNGDLSNKLSSYKNQSYKEEQVPQITNIAIFGLDKRNVDDASRSDCIIILSVDEADKTIKLSSIMRDTYVSVYGHGMTKITHAYAYGGPVLALRTLNENFGLNIKDFIAVDFFQFEKLIDMLGGVTVDVMPDEIQDINECMSETGGIEKKSFTPVTAPGTQVLNGMQVVAYCRVRYTAGDDYKRTERQRDVLQQVLQKLFKVNVDKYPEVAANLLSCVETSLDSSKVLKLALDVYHTGIQNIDKQRFPLDSCSKGETIDGIWYLATDLNTTKDEMHKYIYENQKP